MAKSGDNYVLTKDHPLEEQLRWTVLSEVKKKQEVLLSLIKPKDVTDTNKTKDQATLAALPWPKIGQTAVKAQSLKQPALGMGTGFSIGAGFVATAGHNFEKDERLNQYYAVFGYVESMAKNKTIPPQNVFILKRHAIPF